VTGRSVEADRLSVRAHSKTSARMKLASAAIVLCLAVATAPAAPVKSAPAPTDEDCLTCHEDPAAKRANGTSVFVE
jgi:hypothetical protein